ncbi:MAG: hypothetical protein WCJ31_10920 [Planctomycetia bacterium]
MSLQVISRRFFGLGVVVLAGLLGAGSAEAQDIRFFVKQTAGLFEITATATGGKFVIAPTGEKIVVDGVAIPVQGRTDRASNAETVVTQVRGSGQAFVTVSYAPSPGTRQAIFSGQVILPYVFPPIRSLYFDNYTVTVTQYIKTVTRRLPIGPR